MITTLHRHEVSKGLQVLWILPHPLESCEVGVERFLEDGSFVGGNILVLGFLEEIWNGLSDRSWDVMPDLSSAVLKRPLVDLGLHMYYRSGYVGICEEGAVAIGRELIYPSLLDHAESRQRAQDVSYR
jgi:hypothetical protein